MNLAPLKVGEQVWFVLDSPKQQDETGKLLTVVKVGTKWATLENHVRLEKRTLAQDPAHWSSRRGSYYRSQEAWLEYRAAREVLQDLVRCLGYSPEPGVTAANVRQAASLLRIRLDRDK